MIFLAFFLMTGFLFIAAILGTRPTRAENRLDRRIAEILRTQTDTDGDASPLTAPLEVTQPSSLKPLNDWLGHWRLSRALQLLIVQGQTSTSVGAITILMLGLFAGTAAAGAVLVSPLLGLGAAVPVALLPLLYLRFRKKRRVAAFNAALPEAIALCGRSLRVGHSLVAALSILAEEAAEPARTEFAEVFKKQNYGLPLRDALLQMLDRVPSVDLQVFVTGILVQKDTGGNLAEILDRIVEVIRERLRIGRDVRVHTAQGRLTGWILCLLPPIMLLLINVMNPGYSNVLFQEPTGRKLLYAGLGLLAVGAFLIRQIVNGIEV